MNQSSLPTKKHSTRHYEMYSGAMSEDSVATILRFHLLTEYYLEQMIRLVLSRGDRIIDSGNYSYAQKLGIVEASDKIGDKLISSLRNLNKLRNKCSHELNHQITDSDLERVGSPLGKFWTQIKNEQTSTRAKLGHLCGTISAALGVELDDLEQVFHGVTHDSADDA
ncbi:hypothetical protein [Xanthomonas sp. 3075]|uniref:hypothetical protein n=1 Tax=Xanthomonas sp. 3075 TaxID=3035315 RepID=UPI001618E887|nr:hypothetical protein [Xanthomonas sp. 3075]MBB4133400.1 hypothetical protein [Xanthomonas sp. 3075]